jgi:purine nucleoside phosphorylase
MSKSKLAVICGSGPSEEIADSFSKTKKYNHKRNKYGKVSNYQIVNVDGQEVLFMQRHGKGRRFLTPAGLSDQKRYEANILELHKRGVTDILSFSCVGIAHPYWPLVEKGVYVVSSSYVRGPGSKQHSFYDLGLSDDVLHTPAQSFDSELTDLISGIITDLGGIALDGVYEVTGGDTYETPEEIKRELTAHISTGDSRVLIFGMTAPYEKMLASQHGIKTGLVALPTNYAAGIKEKFDHVGVKEQVAKAKPFIVNIINKFMKEYFSRFLN